MHEAHMAHGTPMTWKEILLHIGIITVGLLIALGLDQIAEYFHHRHQLSEVRQQLKNELALNALQYGFNIELMKHNIPDEKNDLILLHFLRQHAGAPRSQWPAVFRYSSNIYTFDSFAWDNFRQGPLFNYMPYDEQRKWDLLYGILSRIGEDRNLLSIEFKQIRTISFAEPDLEKLSPSQLDELIMHFTNISVLRYHIRVMYSNLHHYFPESFPTPDIPEVQTDMKDFNTPADMVQLSDSFDKQILDKENQYH